MKPFFAAFVLTLSLSATAQTANVIYQRACGPKDASFDVQIAKGQPPAAPEPGKALVFFIQKAPGSYFTTRIGLDGAWVGVIQKNSYIFAYVAAGEHHACAASLSRKHLEAELVHFTAEAGKTYYYLVYGIEPSTKGAFSAMEFFPLDSDEALALIAADPQSTSTPKP